MSYEFCLTKKRYNRQEMKTEEILTSKAKAVASKRTKVIYSDNTKEVFSHAFKEGFKTGQRQTLEVLLILISDDVLEAKLQKELDKLVGSL